MAKVRMLPNVTGSPDCINSDFQEQEINTIWFNLIIFLMQRAGREFLTEEEAHAKLVKRSFLTRVKGTPRMRSGYKRTSSAVSSGVHPLPPQGPIFSAVPPVPACYWAPGVYFCWHFCDILLPTSAAGEEIEEAELGLHPRTVWGQILFLWGWPSVLNEFVLCRQCGSCGFHTFLNISLYHLAFYFFLSLFHLIKIYGWTRNQ